MRPRLSVSITVKPMILLVWLGFYIATGVYMAFFAWFLGHYKWYGIALAGLVTLKFTRGHLPLRNALWLAEAVLVAFFLALPKLFYPLFKAIMAGSAHFGSFMFLVISTITFYLVLTPIALVMRLFGKRFLQPKIDPRLPTYYEEGSNAHDIEKQY